MYKCSSCIFGDACFPKYDCEYYAPFDEDLDAAVEEAREEYRLAYMSYLAESEF